LEGFEGFDSLPLIFRDISPPVVVTTEHALLQAAEATFSYVNAAAGGKVAITVPLGRRLSGYLFALSGQF
jgi:hypothetical protein